MKHWIDTYPHDIYASVLLLDEKIEGWKVGDHATTPTTYLKKDRLNDYVTKCERWNVNNSEEHNLVFSELAPAWFRQWELADDYRLIPPYTDVVENSIEPAVNLHQQIKEALEMATPGPWKFEQVVGGYSTDEGRFVGVDESIICHFGNSEPYYPSEGSAPSGYDMKLIANAPTYIRYLLDELEKTQNLQETLKEALSAVIGEGRKDKSKADEWTNAVTTEARQLRTEHAAMKEALEKISNQPTQQRNYSVALERCIEIADETLSTLSQPKEGMP